MPHTVMVFWTPSMDEPTLGQRMYVCSWNQSQGLTITFNRESAPFFDVSNPNDMIRANNYQQIISNCLTHASLLQFEVFNKEKAHAPTPEPCGRCGAPFGEKHSPECEAGV